MWYATLRQIHSNKNSLKFKSFIVLCGKTELYGNENHLLNICTHEILKINPYENPP